MSTRMLSRAAPMTSRPHDFSSHHPCVRPVHPPRPRGGRALHLDRLSDNHALLRLRVWPRGRTPTPPNRLVPYLQRRQRLAEPVCRELDVPVPIALLDLVRTDRMGRQLESAADRFRSAGNFDCSGSCSCSRGWRAQANKMVATASPVACPEHCSGSARPRACRARPRAEVEADRRRCRGEHRGPVVGEWYRVRHW